MIKKLFLFKFILMSLFFPLITEAASFYFSPEFGNYETGKNFSVDIFINTKGNFINAAQGAVGFSSEKLEVIDVLKNDSIFTLWFEEPVWSNSEGKIFFGGGLPNPGYEGEAGKIMTIVFKAKSEGNVILEFRKEAIRANDPEGTNIFSSSREVSFLLSKGIDKAFDIFVDNEGDPTNPQPLLFFQARDDISYYEIKIGSEDFFKISLDDFQSFRLPKLIPGSHKIIIRGYDLFGNHIDSETNVEIKSIPVPKITIYPKSYIAGEEILYLEGTAFPGHDVIVFLETIEGEAVKTWEIYSDEKGEWSLREKGLFRPGSYKISTKTRDGRGAISDFSEKHIIKVSLSGFVLGPLIISYKNLTFFISFSFFLVLVIIFYLLWKIKRTKKNIDKEAKDLRQKFNKEYWELYFDIKKELEVLRSLRGEGKIKKEEKMREIELLKNLNDVKEVFEKELKDIENL